MQYPALYGALGVLASRRISINCIVYVTVTAWLKCAADGFLGLRGWQWLFLLEGIPTVFLGIWVWATLAPSPLEAGFLTQPEREYVHQRVKSHKVCACGI